MQFCKKYKHETIFWSIETDNIVQLIRFLIQTIQLCEKVILNQNLKNAKLTIWEAFYPTLDQNGHLIIEEVDQKHFRKGYRLYFPCICSHMKIFTKIPSGSKSLFLIRENFTLRSSIWIIWFEFVTRFDPFLMLFKRNRKSKLDFLNFNLVEIKIFEKLEIFSQRMFGLIHLRSFWIKIDDPGWSIVTNTWLNKVSDKIFKNRTFSSFRSPKFKIFSIFE